MKQINPFEQLSFEGMEQIVDREIQEKGGTFILNKGEPIHRWYSYLEGYSSCLIEDELRKIMQADQNVKVVYDPFCGTGTTSLVAAQNGLFSYYSESNPFMQNVIDAKINVLSRIVKEKKSSLLKEFLHSLPSIKTEEYILWDGFEKYFGQPQLSQLLSLKSYIMDISDSDVRKILMLCLSSIVILVSKMIRRGDLRYATEKEYKPLDVYEQFHQKLSDIIYDIDTVGSGVTAVAEILCEDSRDNQLINEIDCVITSPPYLNGTNYIRNTKIELKLNDFITSEKDLPAFHSKGIVAGINNVSKRKCEYACRPILEPYIEALLPVSYDGRIPKMIMGYFADMDVVIKKLSDSIRPGGFFVMDIGDSQFAGVHIPTDKLLSKICESYGFELASEEILRKRRSKNGMVLSQVLLRYRLEK